MVALHVGRMSGNRLNVAEGRVKLAGDLAVILPDLPNNSKWFLVIYGTVTIIYC
jgi:hypothetical protein